MKNYSGGVDLKVTNFELNIKMSAIAQSGPTTNENRNLPVFKWITNEHLGIKRIGVPESFDFPFILMSPATLSTDSKNDIYYFK